MHEEDEFLIMFGIVGAVVIGFVLIVAFIVGAGWLLSKLI